MDYNFNLVSEDSRVFTENESDDSSDGESEKDDFNYFDNMTITKENREQFKKLCKEMETCTVSGPEFPCAASSSSSSKEEPAQATANQDVDLDDEEEEEVKEEEKVKLVPRPYQVELLTKALGKNVIVLLATGTGKTFISENLIREFLYQTAPPLEDGGKRIFFVAPTDPLVYQQARDITWHIGGEVGCFTGSRNLGLVKEKWQEELVKCRVLVMTPAILMDLLQHSVIRPSQINLLIFDECHHAVGDHPYQEIMKCFADVPLEDWPRIMGLTASLINKKVSPSKIEKLIRDLESLFGSVVVTASDKEAVRECATDPKEELPHVYSFETNCDMQYLLDMVGVCINELFGSMTREDFRGFEDIHIHDPENTFDNEFKYFINPKKGLETILRIMATMGPHCASFTLKLFLDEMKKLEDSKILSVKEKTILESTQKKTRALWKIVNLQMAKLKIQTQVTALMSAKLKKLLEIIAKREAVLKPLCCIIFVKEKVEACCLSWWLNLVAEQNQEFKFVRSGFIVGHGNRDVTLLKKSQTQVVQQKFLAAFNRGETNILVSTSIVEEGIHIRKCNHVVRYELPPNFRSYVQSKGRARAKLAFYDVLVDESEFRKYTIDYENYQQIEKMIYEKALDRAKITQEEVLSKLCNYIIPPYIFNTSRITLNSAVPLLYRYCSSLTREPLKPRLKVFKFTCESTLLFGYVCTIKLPAASPLRDIVEGPPMATVKLAKKAASLRVCTELHQRGELDDHLLPKRKDLEEDNYDLIGFTPCEEATGPDQPQPGGRRRMQFYTRNYPSLLHPQHLTSAPCYYLYKVSFETPKDSGHQGFGLVTLKPLPQVPVVSVFHPQGQRRTSLKQIGQQIQLGGGEISTILNVHQFIFKHLLTLDGLQFQAAKSPYLLLCVPLIGDSIHWRFMDVILKPPEDIPKQPFEYVEEHYRNAIIFQKYGDHRKFLVHDIVHELHPTSPFPSEKFNDFKDYYHQQYSLAISCDDQPLLHPSKMPTVNRAVPLNHKLKKPKLPDEYTHFLIPELCGIFVFSKDLWDQALCLPSYLHRLTSLLSAMELHHQIFPEILPLNWAQDTAFPPSSSLVYPMSRSSFGLQFDQHPPLVAPHPGLLLSALTTTSAADIVNLERLEMIGDSFLKFSVSLFLYCTLDDKEEGRLTILKSKIVSNRNLYNLCQKKNIPGSMVTQPFEANTTWLPPGFLAHRKAACIDDKSTADAVEALIGAYLLSSGPLAALTFMTWLGVKVVQDQALLHPDNQHNVPFSWSNIPEPRIYIENRNFAHTHLDKLYKKDFAILESNIKYTFKNKIYVIQAFIHPSYYYNIITDCYQRLEFLGDAILDYMITCYIYFDDPKRSPGELTNLRSSLVNNNFFAFLAVKHHLNHYLRHSSPDLNAQVRSYVDNLQPYLLASEEEQQLDFYLNQELLNYDVEMEPPKALGDLLEALVGAVYLDSGLSLDTTWRVVFPLLKPALDKFCRSVPKNPITVLCEAYPSTKFSLLPKLGGFSRIQATVSDKDGSTLSFVGEGQNRVVAKRNAARKALASIMPDE